jgi:hypothetical protein
MKVYIIFEEFYDGQMVGVYKTREDAEAVLDKMLDESLDWFEKSRWKAYAHDKEGDSPFKPMDKQYRCRRKEIDRQLYSIKEWEVE